MPQEVNRLILKGLQGQPASSKPPPCLTILHSQKVLIHNRNVYCFEQTTFPSVLFLLAMENSWEVFNISVMNLKAVLKTLFESLFRWLNLIRLVFVTERDHFLHNQPFDKRVTIILECEILGGKSDHWLKSCAQQLLQYPLQVNSHQTFSWSEKGKRKSENLVLNPSVCQNIIRKPERK